MSSEHRPLEGVLYRRGDKLRNGLCSICNVVSKKSAPGYHTYHTSTAKTMHHLTFQARLPHAFSQKILAVLALYPVRMERKNPPKSKNSLTQLSQSLLSFQYLSNEPIHEFIFYPAHFERAYPRIHSVRGRSRCSITHHIVAITAFHPVCIERTL